MYRRLLLAAPLLLIACARAEPPRIVVVTPAPAPVVTARPIAPSGFAASFVTPPRDALGDYATPNHGIGDGERLWHLRAALNVAALACRESDMAPAYNAMLARLSAPFAAANTQTEAVYRARHAAAWRDTHDDAMTRLYNWFSQPFAKPQLCRAAADALTEAQTIDPALAADFARRHLPVVEAAVLDGYRRWDAYRVADAAWASRYEAPMASLVTTQAVAAR